MEYSIGEILAVTGGRLISGSEGALVSGVSTDSRTVASDELFIPLVGETHDAHKFLKTALLGKCNAALTAQPEALPAILSDRKSVILVDDTLLAMQRIAGHSLDRMKDLRLRIAITGTTGKTSTKEILYTILAHKFRTVKTEKNFNGDIGFPISVFDMPEDGELAVLEMGMDRPGEITRLVGMGKPTAAVITNVGYTHGEFFPDGRAGIFREKLSIAQNFTDESTLIIGSGSDILTRESAAGPKNGYAAYKILSAGCEDDDDFRVVELKDMGEKGISFAIERRGEDGGIAERADFTLSFPGRHNAGNTALACAAASLAGVSLKEAAEALKGMKEIEERTHIEDFGPYRLIDDAYNANPESTMAAIDTLMASTPPKANGRRVAIIGDMRELGKDAERLHHEVGKYVAERKPDALVCVGDLSRHIAAEARTALGAANVEFFGEDTEALLSCFDKIIKPGDIVLVKMSHFYGMKIGIGKVIERIKGAGA